MRSPTLSELPAPGPGRAGWPWTEETPQLTETTPDGHQWPLISIVAPSFNQAEFIEETIRSVLLQGYPNLEFIITDGGSTDGAIEIIRKYQRWLAAWVSEPDQGQSDAINKGFRMSHGSILAWVNTDDTYEKGAFAKVGAYFVAHPEIDVLYGNAKITDRMGSVIAELRTVPFSKGAFLYNTVQIAVQSAMFWRREPFFSVGLVDEGLHYAMDVDLLVRFVKSGATFGFTRTWLGTYRHHDGSKTVSSQGASANEADKIEALGRLGSSPSYRLVRFLYRMRQFALLICQGDIRYVISRIMSRFHEVPW